MNFEAFFSPWRPYALSMLRIMTALLYLEEGTMKLFGFPPSHFHPSLFSLFGVAGVMEVVGGVLLVIGLFTRPVAFIFAGEMAVAYFMFSAPQSFFPVINHGNTIDPVLLHLPLFRHSRRRPVEPRPLARDRQPFGRRDSEIVSADCGL